MDSSGLMNAEAYADDRLCLLCLASLEGVGAASLHRLLTGARGAAGPLRRLLELPAGELTARFGIPAQVACILASVEDPLLKGEAVLELLSQLEARPVFEGDPDYPAALVEHLGASAPAVVFLGGNPRILREPCVAVVGSRQPSPAAACAALTFAAQQAAQGVTVVSGGAQGIDSAAHRGALSTGASVVVPTAGIARFEWPGIVLPDLSRGSWCVLGQFPPAVGWRRHNALIRNRTIVALSGAVVAFEPRDTGGTWHSCLTALRMNKPLFVASTCASAAQRRGLRQLVRFGAAALDLRHMPEHAAFEELVRAYCPPPGALQLPLFEVPDELP